MFQQQPDLVLIGFEFRQPLTGIEHLIDGKFPPLKREVDARGNVRLEIVDRSDRFHPMLQNRDDSLRFGLGVDDVF